MKFRLLPLAFAIALGGCSMAPSYEQPEPQTDAGWLAQDAGQVELPEWQTFFADDNLRLLIATALDNNRDLRAAALNVEAFAALYRIERSAIMPDVGVSAGGQRQRTPGTLAPDGRSSTSSQYDAGIGISSWEMDFFGRLNSLRTQALENYLASEQAQRSAELSLIAAVATAWLNHSADLELLGIARDSMQSYQESLDAVQKRYDADVASALELQQAISAHDGALATVAQLKRQSVNSRNALQLLLGTQIPELASNQTLDDIELAQLPEGLPAELLQRRPDILQAEHQLKAANANIGAARAAFFPNISLTANAGSASSELSDLFGSGSGTWLFRPQINLPIFTGGRLRASLDYSKLQKDMRIAQYEYAIQTAFQEVANGLSARSTFQEQLAAQDRLLQSSKAYLELAQKRYDEGIDNRLMLLDAQRLYFNTQQQRVSTKMAQLASEISLYKALGGGYGNPDSES